MNVLDLFRKSTHKITKILTIGSFFVFPLSDPAMAVHTEWYKLVDYGDEGYSETTDNWLSWNQPTEAIGGSYRYLSREVGDTSRTGTATWQTTVPYCGKYRVRVSARKTINRTPDADYFVTNSTGGLDHFVINQLDHRNILDWDILGDHYYEKGQTVIVKLDGTDDGWSDCADAVLWELIEMQRCKNDAVIIAPVNSLLLKLSYP